MPEAITNTSPLVYLHRIQALEWLPQLFHEIWTPSAVIAELEEGLRRQHDVPDSSLMPWLRIVEPTNRPSEWLSTDLGAGELAAISLALDYPSKILILDDSLARRTAMAADLTVWGTLKVILEAKVQGLTERVEPQINRLAEAGLWFSDQIRDRILRLAGEKRT